MKFILIVVISSMGGGGMNQWRQPAFSMATFDDEAACVFAAGQAAQLVRQARLEYVDVKTTCVPAASLAAEKK